MAIAAVAGMTVLLFLSGWEGGGKPRLTNIMPCLTNSMLHLSFTENYKGFLALKDLRVNRETESSAGMKTAASPLENDEFYVHLELETITKTQEIIPKNAPNVSISLSYIYIYIYTQSILYIHNKSLEAWLEGE